MYDDEARLIERLNDHFPGWRQVSDDPYFAADILRLQVPKWTGPTEDEDETPNLDDYEGVSLHDHDDD